MRYVGYMRQKPWQEMEKPLSIEEQYAVIEKYAQDKEWTITECYVDNNESDDSEKLQQMIRDGMGRSYDGVIVASFPYFSTDQGTAIQTAFEIFYAAGIRFAVVDDDFDSSNLSRKEVAEYFECKRRKMYSNAAVMWLNNGDDLFLQKGIPYGYKPSENGLTYVKDEDVCDYVEGVFQQYLAGSKAIDIARWLNENDILTRAAYRQVKRGKGLEKNTKWNSNEVLAILENEIYTGKGIRKYGGRVAEISYEPYITEEEQKLILTRLRKEKRKTQRNVSDKENPFRLKIFYASSGRSMLLHDGKEFTDSKFNASHGKKTRKAHSIPFEIVMAKVQEQTAEEKQCAERALKKIVQGKAADAFLEARTSYSEQMKGVMKKMRYYLEKGLYEPELRALDEEAARISEEYKRLETAFSPQNKWICLFLNTDIPAVLDRQTCQKLIERIEVSEDYHDVRVEFKGQEMKKYLPEEWWKEAMD